MREGFHTVWKSGWVWLNLFNPYAAYQTMALFGKFLWLIIDENEARTWPQEYPFFGRLLASSETWLRSTRVKKFNEVQSVQGENFQ